MGQVVNQGRSRPLDQVVSAEVVQVSGRPRGRSGSAAYEVDIERAWLGTPGTLWVWRSRGRPPPSHTAREYGSKVSVF